MVRPARATIADNPRQLELWDGPANEELDASADPHVIGHRSSRPRRWRCPVADDHRWAASPASIANSLAKGYNGCPACAGRQLSITNSFSARHPHLVELWDVERNNGVRADQVLAGCPEKYWWTCERGPDHRWQVSPLVQSRQGTKSRHRGCPFCAGKRPSITNSVAAHPTLAGEWHPTRNDDLSPHEVVAGSMRKVWWRCPNNPDHEWLATTANRVRGRGCPHCKTSLRSTMEVCLYFELRPHLPEVSLEDDKVLIDGAPRHVDLLIPARRLVIEVDGRYHHSDPADVERDTRKTADLIAAGYRVIRVREEPLTAITDLDVVHHRDATVKEVADLLISRLADLHVVQRSDALAYAAQPTCQHLDSALAHLQAMRPGKTIRLPGPPTFSREDRWEHRIALLTDYVQLTGHANVPFEHVHDGFALGHWVGAQRRRRNGGRLPAERAQFLQSLPGWTWDPIADSWETGFRHLGEYLHARGDLAVPAEYLTTDGYPLGSWVRSHRRRGGRRTMTPAQRERLEAVPGWTYERPLDVSWDKACSALESFAAREGHCRMSRGHEVNGVNVDAWSKQQRARYLRGDLRADRAARLEAVPGWSWSPQEDAWETGFAALQAVAEHTGHASVPPRGRHHGYPVGAWVGEQRMRRREGTLSAARVARLERLPGWSWDPHEDSWQRHYAALLAFVEREGHAEVPTGHDEAGLPLSSWVIRHRQDYKAGKVTARRGALLEALPGWTWDVLGKRWEDAFGELSRYTREHGHARVPQSWTVGDLRLGQWVVVQRQAMRLGRLSDERAERLAALPGWVWNGRAS